MPLPPPRILIEAEDFENHGEDSELVKQGK